MAVEIVITCRWHHRWMNFQGLLPSQHSKHKVRCTVIHMHISNTQKRSKLKKIEQMTSRFGHKSTEKFIRCHTRSHLSFHVPCFFFSLGVETNKNGQNGTSMQNKWLFRLVSCIYMVEREKKRRRIHIFAKEIGSTNLTQCCIERSATVLPIQLALSSQMLAWFTLYSILFDYSDIEWISFEWIKESFMLRGRKRQKTWNQNIRRNRHIQNCLLCSN